MKAPELDAMAHALNGIPTGPVDLEEVFELRVYRCEHAQTVLPLADSKYATLTIGMKIAPLHSQQTMSC